MMGAYSVLVLGLVFPIVFGLANSHSEAVEKLVQSNTAFAVKLYHQILKQPGVTNVVFSPVSVSGALAMLRLGANGNSCTEIEKVLELKDMESSLVNSALGELNGLLFNKPKNWVNVLKGANCAFVSKKTSVLNDYKNALSVFGATIEELDFSEPGASVSLINEWISEKTGDLIQDMLPADAINPMTELILTSTLYFSGEWSKGFSPNQTEERDFYVSHYRIIKTPFMYQKGKFRFGYIESIGLQVLEMSYVDQDISMFILLPDNFDLKSVEKNLNHENLTSWIGELYYTKVDLTFPKFKIEASVELQEALRGLGVSDIFSPGKADLSGITGVKSLHVDKIVHKGVLEVTEEGSKAAAATSARLLSRSIDLETRFFADHPFVWLLRHNDTGHILFLGRFTRPEGEEMSHQEL